VEIDFKAARRDFNPVDQLLDDRHLDLGCVIGLRYQFPQMGREFYEIIESHDFLGGSAIGGISECPKLCTTSDISLNI
jgi:hypothetical protein